MSTITIFVTEFKMLLKICYIYLDDDKEIIFINKTIIKRKEKNCVCDDMKIVV